MNVDARHWMDIDRGLASGVIVVGLGGNLDGKEVAAQRMEAAVEALSKAWGAPVISGFFVSKPTGPVIEQADFVNGVAAWKPREPVNPDAALESLQEQETEHGRRREISGGARTLDLDLLLVGDTTRDTESLRLPHPRMCARAFVLRPLVDLFGFDFVVPGQRLTLSELLATPGVASQCLWRYRG